MSALSIVLRANRGFKTFLRTWSRCWGSNMSSQKLKEFVARRTSVEADCERCFVADGGEVVFLVTEWDREICLGVVMGDSEGDFGESGKSSVGVFLDCCGRGINWAGLSGLVFSSPFGWDWDGVWGCTLLSLMCFFVFSSPFCWGWDGVWGCTLLSLMCFFSPPSFCESPLSLRLFKLTATSMLSVWFVSLVFFGLAAADDDDGFAECTGCCFAVADDADSDWVFAAADGCCCCFSVVVVLVVTVVVVFALVGVFFLFFPLCTWVHPSSSLSGWSPVSALGLSLTTIAVVFIVDVVAAAAVVAVVCNIFWGQDLEKCPSYLQFQHWGFLPSTTTVITCVSYSIVWGMAPNPPRSKHMVKT